MANYQITFWKHIPSQVKAWDETGEVKGMMPDRFQVAIDAYSMAEGSTDMDAYLEGWQRGPVKVRDGTPGEVLAAVIQELDAANPRSALMKP
ncbi:MAG TPA: virulence factor [Candidatus Dormibacteraeota bacterium]|jgi:acetamidase/formamidase